MWLACALFNHMIPYDFWCFVRPLLVFCWFLNFYVSPIILMPLVDLGIHWNSCLFCNLQVTHERFAVACVCSCCLCALVWCVYVGCCKQQQCMHAPNGTTQHKLCIQWLCQMLEWWHPPMWKKTSYVYVYICINRYTLAYIHMNSLYMLCKLE